MSPYSPRSASIMPFYLSRKYLLLDLCDLSLSFPIPVKKIKHTNLKVLYFIIIILFYFILLTTFYGMWG